MMHRHAFVLCVISWFAWSCALPTDDATRDGPEIPGTPGGPADPSDPRDPTEPGPSDTVQVDSQLLAALREIWARTMSSGVEEGAFFSHPPGAPDVLVASPIPTGEEASITFDARNVPPGHRIWGDAHTHPAGLGEHPPSFDDMKSWAFQAPSMDMTWRYVVDGETLWAITYTNEAAQLFARSSATLPWSPPVRQYVRQRYADAIESAVLELSAADGRSPTEVRAIAMDRFDNPPETYLAPGQAFGVMEAWLMARHGYLLIPDWPTVTDGPVPNRLAQAEALTHQLRMDLYRGSMTTGVLARIAQRTDLVRPTDTLLSWLDGADAVVDELPDDVPAFPCCIGTQVYSCDGWATAFACLDSHQTTGCRPVTGACAPGVDGMPGEPGPSS